MFSKFGFEIISSVFTLENSAILSFLTSSIGLSDLQTIKSGWIPTILSSLTECWTGLDFISPTVSKIGR